MKIFQIVVRPAITVCLPADFVAAEEPCDATGEIFDNFQKDCLYTVMANSEFYMDIYNKVLYCLSLGYLEGYTGGQYIVGFCPGYKFPTEPNTKLGIVSSALTSDESKSTTEYVGSTTESTRTQTLQQLSSLTPPLSLLSPSTALLSLLTTPPQQLNLINLLSQFSA